MKDSIKKEAIFDSSIDRVWNAISKEEEISKWFLNADFKAEKGYEYTFTSKEEHCEPIIGKIKSADPYVLIYTWEVKGTYVETIVTWKLETVEKGTKLTLEHTGIANYAADTAIKMFESFDGGWDKCVNGLHEFLAGVAHAK